MLKSNLGRADFFVMRVLYDSSSGLQPYTIFQRSKLSGEVFFKVFNRLISEGLVVERKSLLYLSSQGRDVFLAGSSKVMSSDKKWREVPESMRGRKLGIDDFYVPNINIM
jgi:hypothetical protein